MGREIDEGWIEEAVERYRRIEALQEEFDQAARGLKVTVHSPDGLVELVITAAGAITDVRITGALQGRSGAELSHSIQAAVTAAGDAARWAREKLHAEMFAGYRPLREV
ncbi:YbaB/EbfC family nucleoid-associated protein [Phytohabitans kaempferiae]|uniref:YbaB/EbfC family nucleoid-associated protein n=1 Tax=Phytohabitans kaempferiae TaxID=1620943 RepID=A0ABV6LWF5_9ACTN